MTAAEAHARAGGDSSAAAEASWERATAVYGSPLADATTLLARLDVAELLGTSRQLSAGGDADLADLVAPFAAVQEAARTLAGVLNEAVSAPQDSNPRARSALLELDSSSNIVRG